MLPPLVVFWLAAPVGHADAHAELEQWAADRGYRPVAAAEAHTPVYDDSVAREIEALLEEARAVAPEAPASFQRLDRLLTAHPELPQGGWWAAERYTLEAQSRTRGAERELAAERELVQRARELEGPRATGAGIESAGDSGISTRHEPLQITGVRPHDEVLVDGESAGAGAELGPGSHHVQLFRAQRRVWAGWVDLGSPPLLHIADPTPACSELDLSGTEYAAQGPVAAPGVRCDAWAVGHARAGEIELSFCRGDHCSAWERRDAAGAPGASADVGAVPSPVPSWVTWGALGVGAAASTLLVLWQAGAFERPTPPTEFVFTGPTAAALRF